MREHRIQVADRDETVRRAAFALLLSTHRPVSVSRLAAVTGLAPETISDVVARLAANGFLDLQDDGRVLGSQGLTLGPAPHRIQLGGDVFQTWCAYDALGIVAALQANARIETRCGVCQRQLTLRARDGYPNGRHPEWLWLAEGGSDLRGDFCTPTVLLCSGDHARQWAEDRQDRGKALTVEDGARLGAAAWQASADTARRLGYRNGESR